MTPQKIQNLQKSTESLYTYIDKEQKLYELANNNKKITNILKQIKYQDFNQDDYSTEAYFKTNQNLIKKIQKEKYIMEFLKFLVHITSYDYSFIQCGSNSLHLLIQMKVDLKNIDFENIRIKNTSLIGANFVNCYFNGSLFDNVDICGINFNGAQLFNCKWKNIKIMRQIRWSQQSCQIRQQKSILDGHSNYVRPVSFSPDGTTLASGSYDISIHLWDVKTGQQKSKLDGHQYAVNSVCFSPDGTTLAYGSDDKFIRLWNYQIGQEIQSTDKNYKDILAQFNTQFFQQILFQKVISQQAIFQAQGALIFKGEFVNQSGIDLKALFKQKGSCFLENEVVLQQK